MSPHASRATRRALPAALLVALAAAPVTSAQTGGGPVDTIGPSSPRLGHGSTRAEPTVDQRVGQKLNKVVEALEAGKTAEARGRLETLQRSFLSPYERSRVENLLAVVAQAEQRYAEAREHVTKAIATGGLNDQELLTARYQLAQLFVTEERWREGIAALKAWFAAGATPNSNAYYLLAIAHYQLGEYAEALEPAQKAIAGADRPQESWLQLLLALRVERREYAEAVPILHTLLDRAPLDKTYWAQLSSVHSMLEDYDEALTPLQVAYHGGLLTEESEYRRLVDLLLHAGIPARAGVILARAIEEKKVAGDARDWEKLGDCWIAARELEKAAAALGRAGALSEGGGAYVRLAEVHAEREEWEKALDAGRRAIQKGKLENVADVEMVLGVASFGLERHGEARAHFLRAVEADPRRREQVRGWLRAIEAGPVPE